MIFFFFSTYHCEFAVLAHHNSSSSQSPSLRSLPIIALPIYVSHVRVALLWGLLPEGFHSNIPFSHMCYGILSIWPYHCSALFSIICNLEFYFILFHISSYFVLSVNIFPKSPLRLFLLYFVLLESLGIFLLRIEWYLVLCYEILLISLVRMLFQIKFITCFL